MIDADDLNSNRVAREMETRIRELERQLGRKTMEAEILKEALDKARPTKDLACAVAAQGRLPVNSVATTLGVSRSHLDARLASPREPRQHYYKAEDAVVVPLITAFVAARPTYGYRHITALLNRQLRSEEAAPVKHEQVYRVMQADSLLLARRYTVRSDHSHDGKVVTLRSPLRSDRWRP